MAGHRDPAYNRSEGIVERAPAPPQMLDLAHLAALMERTDGHDGIRIGLIDGPVHAGHPDLDCPIVHLGSAACAPPPTAACAHGTFVAGILGARRGAGAPALCPRCPLLVRPIFLDGSAEAHGSSPAELAGAIVDVIQAGARIVNLSLALSRSFIGQDRTLHEVLDWAAQKDVLVVAAGGNDGRAGSTPLTRHPWVVPVLSCDAQGRPSHFTNLGGSAARHGLLAPGEGVTSLDRDGGTRSRSGTSFAAPFVTGAAALLWSLFSRARAEEIRAALLDAPASRRRSAMPPLLDAERAYRFMQQIRR